MSQKFEENWDVIVIGGGITGAGIFRQAVHHGYRTLLLEQRDFAWGTSSRSSKLVHGGLRYLKEGQLQLVMESVTERQALLAEAEGLIEPLAFLVPTYKGKFPPPWMLRAGLITYDLLARRWGHQWLDRDDFALAAPHFRRDRLTGGARFWDAQVDDARLVLRLLFDGVSAGGVVANYTPVKSIDGTSVRLEKQVLKARVVMNATGAWADRFTDAIPGRLRPLRGSHLVFPAWRAPCPCALSFNHPADSRPCFVIPWEGATMCGTTDLDHEDALSLEPSIAPEEVDYLLKGLDFAFPGLSLGRGDVLSTWAGVRPVISKGEHVSPSQENREHGIWDENGVITVTGGKLTTFRAMAQEALKVARGRYLPEGNPGVFSFRCDRGRGPRRLFGRYGSRAQELLDACPVEEMEVIPGSRALWAELRWGARAESVCHLDDLLLRRVRLGIVLPRGGEFHFDRIRTICQAELGWDDTRWQEEKNRYLEIWENAYGCPALS